MKTALLILSLGIAVAVLAQIVLALQFSRKIAGFEAALAASVPGKARNDLPAPVADFARRGMAGATNFAAYARLAQTVEMRLSKGAGWTAMRAAQVISAPVPGFSWAASIKAGPLTLVRVVDAYAGGRGLLEVRVLAAFPMGREEGPEADQGEAMRYLAELPWMPDAILTNRAVTWTEIAPGRVRAALAIGSGEAAVEFILDGQGDFIAMEALDRPGKGPDGEPARMAWRGEFGDYGEIGGRRIPRRGEVGWVYADGYEAYWRGRITGYRPRP
jgi:hypothetical protein